MRIQINGLTVTVALAVAGDIVAHLQDRVFRAVLLGDEAVADAREVVEGHGGVFLAADVEIYRRGVVIAHSVLFLRFLPRYGCEGEGQIVQVQAETNSCANIG